MPMAVAVDCVLWLSNTGELAFARQDVDPLDHPGYHPPLLRRFGILLALFASAATARAIEVSTPHDRGTLHGGSYAPLSWSGEKLPAHADEWEAFLSIDGGGHYAFRITPHLNLRLRRVTWLVPNVDAADARILIRTGDEKDKREFVLPMSFVIVRNGKQSLPPLEVTASEPGERGVIQWAEGDRAATRVTQVAIVIPPGGMTSIRDVAAHDSVPADAPKRPQARIVSRVVDVASGGTQQRSNLSNPETHLQILLKIQRQNI